VHVSLPSDVTLRQPIAENIEETKSRGQPSRDTKTRDCARRSSPAVANCAEIFQAGDVKSRAVFRASLFRSVSSVWSVRSGVLHPENFARRKFLRAFPTHDAKCVVVWVCACVCGSAVSRDGARCLPLSAPANIGEHCSRVFAVFAD
jgi:hypothetical protein